MPDTEFKVRVIRMLNELQERIDELTKSLNKENHEKGPVGNEDYSRGLNQQCRRHGRKHQIRTAKFF